MLDKNCSIYKQGKNWYCEIDDIKIIINASHTNSGKKDNATPLFDWGKYYEKNGRTVMPVSVQAHHSFVDGIHIGQFAEKLQKYLNGF